YSGLIYRAIGFPNSMFTAMFAIGRMPGWIAHWREMIADPATRVGRPRQVYTGAPQRAFVAIGER
ncbi:MAG: citrate synthase, partial [Actinomycetota bacterium]|nr:citrate synthase [Actinomycetota bacterium]